MGVVGVKERQRKEGVRDGERRDERGRRGESRVWHAFKRSFQTT